MFQSINPYTGELISEHQEHDIENIKTIIGISYNAQIRWKKNSFDLRAEYFVKMSELLTKRRDNLAKLITAEMGKIYSESIAEIDKCIWLCKYYAEHAEEMLDTEGAESDGTVSYIRFDPLGVLYAIMPWNFPFWQVLRFAVPVIMAGNTVILKHAPNVFGCAKAIEQLFLDSEFPPGIFSNLIIPVELSESVIAHPIIKGVTLTGSQRAGRAVASQAGKYLKKTVLELGGSDPFIVLADVDLDAACITGTKSRMLNAGQVCIAAKRFIVEESIYDQFIINQKKLIENLNVGDPMDISTEVGPMANQEILNAIDRQVKESIKMGANVLAGGKNIDNKFYTPTLMTNIEKGMPVYDEETFGPVSVVIKAENAEDAVRIANDTSFGLGASIWTSNLELADEMAGKIEAGAVFVNGMTKSDPRLPFGGINQSGYGRELSQFGIREFVNIKTVWFK